MRLLLIAVFLFAIPANAARYALLTGNSSGGSGLAALKYVEKDLASVKSILFDHCNFSQQNIRVIKNPTPSELESCLDSIHNILQNDSNDLFLFYYTGHADSKALKMGNDEYSLQEFKDQFAQIKADIRIGIFDACQSGSFTRLKGGQLADPFLFRDDQHIEGQVILSSSSSTENAQESDLFGNSIFTFHLVNSLRGSGDISGDGKVTLAEAYQYTYNHTVSSTSRSWGGVQHPGYNFNLQGEREIVLADLNVKTQGIILDSDISGPLTIFDNNNNIVADFSKEIKKKVIIALKPGKYHVINSKETHTLSINAEVKTGLTALKQDDLKYVKRNKASFKGKKPEKFQLALMINNGFSQYKFDDIDNKLSKEFEGYKLFGINPSYKLSSIRYTPGIDFIIGTNSHFSIQGGLKAAWFEKSDTYKSINKNPLDSQNYAYTLYLWEKMIMIAGETAFDFHTLKSLKGLFIEAGLQFAYLNISLESDFSDSLFKHSAKNSINDHGFTLVPFIESGYLHEISPFCEVGISIRYRIKNFPDQLFLRGNSTYPQLYEYNLNGFVLSLLIKLQIRKLLDVL